MARTTSITIAIGRKLSDGDYGSGDFFVSETVSLDEDDNVKEVRAKLKTRVERYADIEVAKIKEAFGTARRKKRGDD